jgi:hypothetical protein
MNAARGKQRALNIVPRRNKPRGRIRMTSWPGHWIHHDLPLLDAIIGVPAF